MEQEKKELMPGIKIKYEAAPSRGSFLAEFFIGFGEPSETFITNPEIRQAIDRLGKKFGKQGTESIFKKRLGLMHLGFIPETGFAIWSGYYPFGNENAAVQKIFSGKGIASELELRALKKMKEIFPGLRGFRHVDIEPARIKQLAGRGLEGPWGIKRPQIEAERSQTFRGPEHSYEEFIGALQRTLRQHGRKRFRR